MTLSFNKFKIPPYIIGKATKLNTVGLLHYYLLFIPTEVSLYSMYDCLVQVHIV